MQRQGFNMILLLPLHRPKQVYDFHKKKNDTKNETTYLQRSLS